MRCCICVIALVSCCLLQAAPAASARSSVPIEFCGGLIWAKVSVASKEEPLQFLVDSGASASVVNLATARQLHLELGPQVKVSAVGATTSGYWPVPLKAFAGEIELSGDYLVLDLSKLSEACGRRVDGLIGADFFRDRVVEIDFAGGMLRLLDGSPADLKTQAIPLQKGSGSFRVPVSVNGGLKQWVRLDTGCATSFQWVSSQKLAGPTRSASAVGLKQLAIPQILTGLRIGEHHLDVVPTGLHRSAFFPNEAGLIGNGILATFGSIILDAKNGHLFLGRNPLGSEG